LTASAGASGPAADELRELLVFIVRAGSALSAAGNPVFSVQERLTRVAHAYGARHAVISAFPTFLIVTMGSGEPATVELTSVTVAPRLDQIAGLDHLIREAESRWRPAGLPDPNALARSPGPGQARRAEATTSRAKRRSCPVPPNRFTST
jgi:Putative threonine/serine exporter